MVSKQAVSPFRETAQTKTFDFLHHISDLVPVFQKVYKASYPLYKSLSSG